LEKKNSQLHGDYKRDLFIHVAFDCIKSEFSTLKTISRSKLLNEQKLLLTLLE
jgi:hypothetical protein